MNFSRTDLVISAFLLWLAALNLEAMSAPADTIQAAKTNAATSSQVATQGDKRSDAEAYINQYKQALQDIKTPKLIQETEESTLKRTQEIEQSRDAAKAALQKMGARAIPDLIKHLNERSVAVLARDLIMSCGDKAIDPLASELMHSGRKNSQVADILVNLAPKSNRVFISLIQSNDFHDISLGAALVARSLTPEAKEILKVALIYATSSQPIRWTDDRLGKPRSPIAQSNHRVDNKSDEQFVRPLEEAFKRQSDSAIQYNLVLVLSLIAHNCPDVAPFLITVVETDTDQPTRARAIDGLSAIDTPIAKQYLLKVLRSDDAPLVRSEVIKCLPQISGTHLDPKTIDILSNILKTEQVSDLKLACIDVLSKMADANPSTIQELTDAAKDSSDAVHLKALQALCYLSATHPECSWAIGKSLDETDYSTICAAIEAMKNLPDQGKSYLPGICKHLSDRNSGEVVRICEQLRITGEPAAPLAVPSLLQAFGRLSDPMARVQILQTIAAMGPSAKAALPELERIASYQHQTGGQGFFDIAGAARAAISAINGPRSERRNNLPTKTMLDSSNYTFRLFNRVRASWFPPAGYENERVSISFTIHKDGSISNLKIEHPSQESIFDEAAVKAIKTAAPFDAIPGNHNSLPIVLRLGPNENLGGDFEESNN